MAKTRLKAGLPDSGGLAQPAGKRPQKRREAHSNVENSHSIQSRIRPLPLPLSVGKSPGGGCPAGESGKWPQLEAMNMPRVEEDPFLTKPTSRGASAQMAKPAAHVWKSMNSLAGGQEKDLFWGFCQTWRRGCGREVRAGGGQMWRGSARGHAGPSESIL